MMCHMDSERRKALARQFCSVGQNRIMLSHRANFCARFLDTAKACNTLDREPALSIFEAHRIGPNALHLMHNFWDKLTLGPNQGGHRRRKLIDSQRGVTQGGILAPTLFNICENEAHCLTTLRGICTDDGCLIAQNAPLMQNCRDLMQNLLTWVKLLQCLVQGAAEDQMTSTTAGVCKRHCENARKEC